MSEKPLNGSCFECGGWFPLNARRKIPAHNLGPKGKRRACNGGKKEPRFVSRKDIKASR